MLLGAVIGRLACAASLEILVDIWLTAIVTGWDVFSQ
jgi:hypothetical protein